MASTKPRSGTQGAHLKRVRQKLAPVVLAFCLRRLDMGRPQFTMASLATYVLARAIAAPDSPSRVLRDLRRRGIVACDLVSRRESTYRVRKVCPLLPPTKGTPR